MSIGGYILLGTVAAIILLLVAAAGLAIVVAGSYMKLLEDCSE
ncbi:MAG: hypothetical protein SOY47_16830 [Lachnospiraceae bacterium]|nr:hypothetical protein [Lachnospiraceae bacterium]